MKDIVLACSRKADVFAKMAEYLSWLVLLVWVGLIAVGVVMRYVFAAPLIFQGDLVSALLVVFASLSFASLLVREQHIRVDLLTRHFSLKAQYYLTAFSYLVTLLLSALMITASKNLIFLSYMMNSRFDVSGIIAWPFQAVFSFGFLLLGTVSLLRFLEMVVDPNGRLSPGQSR
ncbi:TRAP transporter small permease [Jiella pacifica]|uniref:TRAP transporter small permease protein n=1 Tax=Jiella pacifica TaxID=2696469 RepID=A0A6N9T5E4_9HYPH|nr:TRAP transporter small permease [Jiella pacifica]NDW06607.1 TRAP transporter small permease subunit [Jiella pacifica]